MASAWSQRAESALRWIKRHHLALGLIGAAVAAVVGWLPGVVGGGRIPASASGIETTARNLAELIARAVLYELRARSEGLAQFARSEPRLVEMIRSYKQRSMSERLRFGEEVLLRRSSREAISLFDVESTPIARSLRPDSIEDFFSARFSYRNYYYGVLQSYQVWRSEANPRAWPQPYVARTYRSRANRRYKFTIAVPIVDALGPAEGVGGELLGYLCQTIEVGEALGNLDFLGRIQGMVVGARDAGVEGAGSLDAVHRSEPRDYYVVFHERYDSAEHQYNPVQLPPSAVRLVETCKVRPTIDDQLLFVRGECAVASGFEDPVTGKIWRYAALSPIGTTGYFAIAMLDP